MTCRSHGCAGEAAARLLMGDEVLQMKTGAAVGAQSHGQDGETGR